MVDMETLKIRLKNTNETLKLGEIIGKSLNPGSIIALVGDLGAGKTVLVKGIAKGLGVDEEPNSPTSVEIEVIEWYATLILVHYYKRRNKRFKPREDKVGC